MLLRFFLNYAAAPAARPLVPSLSSLGGLAAGIAHREQALLEVYRVLRPSGRVLVRTVAPEVPYRPRFRAAIFPKVARVFVH